MVLGYHHCQQVITLCCYNIDKISYHVESHCSLQNATPSDCLCESLQGGILALDVQLGKENIVYTAGADHTGQVYDCEDNRVIASLTGHSKKVTGMSSSVAVLHSPSSKMLWHRHKIFCMPGL